jgi:hypothetical protein
MGSCSELGCSATTVDAGVRALVSHDLHRRQEQRPYTPMEAMAAAGSKLITDAWLCGCQAWDPLEGVISRAIAATPTLPEDDDLLDLILRLRKSGARTV